MGQITFASNFAFNAATQNVAENFILPIASPSRPYSVVVNTQDEWTIRLDAPAGQVASVMFRPLSSFTPNNGERVPPDGAVGLVIVRDANGVELARFALTNTTIAQMLADPSILVRADNSFTGSSGNDTLFAGDGDDALNASGGSDWLDGGAGSDVIGNGAGNDTLSGGLGFDFLVIASGATSGVRIDLAITGPQFTGMGTDVLSGFEWVEGSGFSDLLFGDSTPNTLEGQSGDDLLEGRGANDTLLGGSGNDQLNGGDGDDLLNGGSGNDEFRGGAGFDTVEFTNLASAINLDLQVGFAFGGNGAEVLLDVERVFATPFSDIVRGDNNANVLSGGSGDDFLQGRGGGDSLLGGSGSDVLDGGEGNDTLDGGGGDGVDFVSFDSAVAGVNATLSRSMATFDPSFNGTVFGPAGNDTLIHIEVLVGSAFSDILNVDGATTGPVATIRGGAGDDRISARGLTVIEGGAGSDVISGANDFLVTLSYANAQSGVRVDLDASFAQFTGEGFDLLQGLRVLDGSIFSDILLATNVAPTGDPPSDLTFSPFGAPGAILRGGRGDDLLIGRERDDILQGQDDNDVLRGGDGNDTVSGGAGIDVLDGGAGNDLADYSTASSGVRIDLNIDAFQFTGVTGMDHLISIETVSGSAFSDILLGSSGADVLRGNGGDDFIFGNEGIDELLGLDGNDRLEGGRGNDIFSGGAGRDIFTFRAGDGNDSIFDYTDGQDRIQIIAPGITTILQLTITEVGNGAVRIAFGSDSITLVAPINQSLSASMLTQSDFIFGGG